MEGKVKSIIDMRTISVSFEKTIRHPLYQKVLKMVKHFMVHVPVGVDLPKVGDSVVVSSSRPISKKKKLVLK